jgi:hypothetical protein
MNNINNIEQTILHSAIKIGGVTITSGTSVACSIIRLSTLVTPNHFLRKAVEYTFVQEMAPGKLS